MQTKNVNVVQPPGNKIEKNAVAAAANQNGSAVNGMVGSSSNSTSSSTSSSGISSISSNALNATGEHTPMQNGSAVNGVALGGGGGGSSMLQHINSDVGVTATALESTVTIPGVNGTTMTVSAMNGLNMALKSPYQYLHLTSPNMISGMTSSHSQLPGVSSHQHISTASSSSPYQPLPVTSKQQQNFISTASSSYQPDAVTSSHPSVTSSTPFLPPPLPPRVGSSRPSSLLSHEVSSPVHSINTPGTIHSVYKPVPPPKPFVGSDNPTPGATAPAISSSSGSSTINNKTSGLPPPLPAHSSASAEALREQLATVTGSTRQNCGGTPPLLSHILVTDQGQFHTHSTKFPNSGTEDRDQLVNTERQSRYLDGIDNPALTDDSHMPSYRSKGVGGGGANHGLHPPGIPPEGTLAGALPPLAQPRPYESPFGTRPPYQPPQTSAHQHQSASHQPKFTRESWMRNSQGQHSGIIELHPPQGLVHMNGHGPQHSVPTSHISNGNNHVEGHHNHSNNHSNHINGHHPHMNGQKDHNVGANNQNNRVSVVDDNQANGAQEQRNDTRKDEKWGSLTRGIAAKKYQNLKEKLSHKFSRGDKPEDRTNGTSSQVNDKNTVSQNSANHGNPNQGDGSSQPGSSRDSFRRAIHQSSQNVNHQEQHIMETNLSSQQTDALPPQYPRSPSQYRPPHPLPPSSLAHSNYQTGVSSHHNTHHHHDSVNRGMVIRRSGSYHHLSQHHQEPPPWRPHHYSVDNLVDAQAIPSDHTYSGPAVTSSRGQPAGSGGSDSGRGTAGVGSDTRVHNPLDTSLDSAASQRLNAQGHSSGNDSEWIDMTDTELQRIMKKSGGSKGGGRLVRRESLAATPPLPPLSPEGTPSPSPRASPVATRTRKHSLSYSCGGLNKPDLLEAAGQDAGQRGVGEGRTGNSSQGSSQSTPRRPSNSHTHHNHAGMKTTSNNVGVGSRSMGLSGEEWSHRKQEERRRGDSHDPHSKSNNRVNLGPSEGDLDAGEITSTTDALDLDSMLDGGVTEATSDDDATSAYDPDVHLIRKQLEGLEGMYSEVLKLLEGGRRGGRNLLGNMGSGMMDPKSSRRRLHGSLSSLPSSIVSSRPGRDKRRVIDDRVRKVGRDNGGKTIHKRFQRLESHVVTLARSVAHLSSEMRTQHLMLQEIESIRGELASLRTGGNGGNNNGGHTSRGANHVSWESFRAGIPGLSNPGRVKKLTQFFGDEPPLVRIFLRKLGYEKYAGLFEQEKIGMLELPYLTEERLQKIGIPMGPRLRILQEAQGPIRKDGNLSVYVV